VATTYRKTSAKRSSLRPDHRRRQPPSSTNGPTVTLSIGPSTASQSTLSWGSQASGVSSSTYRRRVMQHSAVLPATLGPVRVLGIDDVCCTRSHRSEHGHVRERRGNHLHLHAPYHPRAGYNSPRRKRWDHRPRSEITSYDLRG